MTTPHTNEEILNTRSLAKARDMIKANLAASDKWVLNAVVAIYARQTADEQQSDSTEHHNGVGFSGVDAAILSSFAKQIIAYRAGNGRWTVALTPRQMAVARKKISKYAGQLLQAAHARAAAKAREAAAVESGPEADEWKAEMREVAAGA